MHGVRRPENRFTQIGDLFRRQIRQPAAVRIVILQLVMDVPAVETIVVRVQHDHAEIVAVEMIISARRNVVNPLDGFDRALVALVVAEHVIGRNSGTVVTADEIDIFLRRMAEIPEVDHEIDLLLPGPFENPVQPLFRRGVENAGMMMKIRKCGEFYTLDAQNNKTPSIETDKCVRSAGRIFPHDADCGDYSPVPFPSLSDFILFFPGDQAGHDAARGAKRYPQ